MIGAVLFDCDGVLADTELLVNRLVAAELSARGWEMDVTEARRRFLGLAWPAMRPIVEARIGPLPPGWEQGFSRRIAELLARGTMPVQGALDAVRQVAARLPVAVASNSSRGELAIKMACLGLAEVFGARVFSFEDVPRPKPAPDIYLAAARACGVESARCVVVEDSVTGVRAGIAAGCTVMGLAQETPAEALAAAGAMPFFEMVELPGLLGL